VTIRGGLGITTAIPRGDTKLSLTIPAEYLPHGSVNAIFTNLDGLSGALRFIESGEIYLFSPAISVGNTIYISGSWIAKNPFPS